MRSGFEQHGRKRKEAHESADKSWKELVVQIAAVDPLKWFDRLTMSGSARASRGGWAPVCTGATEGDALN